MGTQVALSLVLLVASGLMVRSFQNVRAIDPGFDARSALTFIIGLPDRDYPNRDRAVAAHQAILDRLAALPGVRAASTSSCLPLAGGCFGNTVRVRGRVLRPDVVPPVALFRAVAAGYFEAMRMRILRGRALDRRDAEMHAPVVVVDQVFADQFFSNQNPIGQYVASNRPPRRMGEEPDLAWREIVGVVSSTPVLTLVDPRPLPQLYMPMSIATGPDTPASLLGPSVAVMSYVIRGSGTTAGLLPSVRRVVDTVDAKLAMAQVQSLEEILDRASAQMAFTMVLLTIASSVAVLLGTIGTYGVMSYLVTQRAGEIGVRLALGAEPRAVVGMIVRQGGFVALVGIVGGLGAASSGSRLIDSLLYGVDGRDPVVLGATTVALSSVALLACWLPARRAARLNPLDALRS
jgi:predicted permease